MRGSATAFRGGMGMGCGRLWLGLWGCVARVLGSPFVPQPGGLYLRRAGNIGCYGPYVSARYLRHELLIRLKVPTLAGLLGSFQQLLAFIVEHQISRLSLERSDIFLRVVA